MVLESPARCDDKLWRALAHEALQHERAGKVADVLQHQADILLGSGHGPGGSLVLPCQCRAAYDLQLVQLERGERQGGHQACLLHEVGMRLPGEAQYHVCPHADASCGCATDGLLRLCEGVAAVHTQQRLLAGALHPIFHQQEGTAVELLQIVQ